MNSRSFQRKSSLHVFALSARKIPATLPQERTLVDELLICDHQKFCCRFNFDLFYQWFNITFLLKTIQQPDLLAYFIPSEVNELKFAAYYSLL